VIGCSCAVCISDDSRDQRLRSSLFITDGDTNILIDAGPDFRQQLLSHHIQRLDAIILTHEHRDHTSGLDDIRALNFIQRAPIPIYCTEQVQKGIRDQFSNAFIPSMIPGLPEFLFKTINDHPFCVNGIEIIPIQVMHYRLLVLGFRISNFTYITDANYISDTELDIVMGSEVFVLNALRHESHISHFSLSESLMIAARVEVPITYLTHISHQMGLHDEEE